EEEEWARSVKGQGAGRKSRLRSRFNDTPPRRCKCLKVRREGRSRRWKGLSEARRRRRRILGRSPNRRLRRGEESLSFGFYMSKRRDRTVRPLLDVVLEKKGIYAEKRQEQAQIA